MTSGRDDKTGGPASPPGEGDLLTSEDIFGDMLDAGRDRSAAPAPAARKAGTRTAPIKVRVPGAAPARKSTPLSSPGQGGALPDDVAALLDVFGEVAPEAPSPAPPRDGAPPARAGR